MVLALARKLFILLLIFSMLERTGLSIAFVITQNEKVNLDLLLSQNEEPASDDESLEEKASKEFWNTVFCFDLTAPVLLSEKKLNPVNLAAAMILFHLSVPSPPPDFV